MYSISVQIDSGTIQDPKFYDLCQLGTEEDSFNIQTSEDAFFLAIIIFRIIKTRHPQKRFQGYVFHKSRGIMRIEQESSGLISCMNMAESETYGCLSEDFYRRFNSIQDDFEQFIENNNPEENLLSSQTSISRIFSGIFCLSQDGMPLNAQYLKMKQRFFT